MEFGNPLALWGLLGLSLPVIIHLVSLQRAKKIYFSSTEFLRQLTVESSSKRKLKEWLILAARLLALLFLIVAFSMPYWKDNSHWNTEQEGLAFQVYLDNSYSMERNPGQGTLLDQSVLNVQSLLKSGSPSTRYQFLDNDFRSSDLLSMSPQIVSKRTSEEDFSVRSRSLSEVVNRFASADQLGKQNKHCFLFSDFQKSTLGSLHIPFDSTSNYYLIPVQNNTRSNVYIDSIWFDRPVVKKGDKLKVFYKAFNGGEEEVKEQLFKLFINEKQAGISYLDIPAASGTMGFFEYVVAESGELKGVITLEDGDLSFDNSFYFTLNASAAIKVASISNRSNPPQNLVFEEEADFSFYACNSQQVNYSQLDEADFILIEGWNGLPQGVVKRIPIWLNTGKSILFIPSSEDQGINSDLAQALVIPALPSKKTDTTRQSSNESLEFPDLHNPFFSDFFEEKNNQVVMPLARPSIALPPGYSTLLSTHGGETAVSRSSVGSAYKGISYIIHFPLDKQNGNLAQHSFFVPLLLKMALLSKENAEKRYFRQSDEVVQLSINQEVGKSLLQIKDAKGALVIPSQRLNGTTFTFDLPEQISQPGFYQLMLNDKSIRTFALNTGREESMTQFYSTGELKEALKIYPNVKVLDNLSEVAFEEQLKELTKGVPLWKYCLFLSLVFFFTEIVLIRWFNK
ncbi:MAG: N-terminal double-transrane protein [Chitinophagaceae bacterium]|nr:N-terminal double-transrane protein [Chitinophagaceae bacterium]